MLVKDYDMNVELSGREGWGIEGYRFGEGEWGVFVNVKKGMNWEFRNDCYIEIIE